MDGFMIRVLDGEGGSPDSRVPDEVARTFAKNGLLQTVLDLEHRPQQEAMALGVVQAICSNQSLLFEAGTGVGKSLAYLMPGLLCAMAAKRPFVVATHTITLQDQILRKDLPLCRLLFEKSPELQDYRDFRAALLVGKANYLCTTRLTEALKQQGQAELFENKERLELQRIAKWAEEDAPRPDPEVWERVNADSSLCSRKRCDPEKCFYQQARDRLADAEVIVVNHSLLFAFLGAGMGPGQEADGILFANDFVVLDEAHQVPKVATDHFGTSLGSYGVALILRRLHHPRKKKGLLAKWGVPSDKGLVRDALGAADGLFSHVRENLLGERDARRILASHTLPSDFLPPVGRLVERLRELSADLDENPAASELKDQAERLECMASSFRDFQEMENTEQVYWVEKYGKKGIHSQLRIVPIDPAPLLRKSLFQRGVSAILTSATLRQGGEMDHFRSSVGADGIAAEAEDSPFDYEKKVRIFVARDCPDPRLPDRGPYLSHLSELIFRCAQLETGGTLALFTNFADLRYVASSIEVPWRKEGRELFVHGAAFSRSELRNRFAEAENGLLLGANSFWMGIDVPGSALSQVLLTRLPFDNPNHPVAEAKAEKIREAGLSAFSRLTLPEALSRFRQGMGRLIRNKEDSGRITILDSRVLRKSYGKRFLAELPHKSYQPFALESFSSEFIR
jgi:ATP-dependent DNA helicase DinG